MASGIAHDFNNHLTGVLAFLEISLDREELDDELRSWLQMSRDSAVAAAEVVKLLRSFYRRDANDALEPVDLNKLASDTISLTRPRWFDMPRRNGLVVEVREDLGDIGPALGNAAELRDALTNLLFNAVDAMPQGGVITVRTRRDGDEVLLEVADAGTGMSDEVRERCLEPFYTTKGMQGTGLGLSMVHGIVERNRGRMTIDSQLGRGTTVALHLTRAEVQVASAISPAHRGQDRRKRILCVDDDVRILKSLEGMLRQLGHDVVTPTSGCPTWTGEKSPAPPSAWRPIPACSSSPAGPTAWRSKATCPKA
jgi:signal transduction histidine kinase